MLILNTWKNFNQQGLGGMTVWCAGVRVAIFALCVGLCDVAYALDDDLNVMPLTFDRYASSHVGSDLMRSVKAGYAHAFPYPLLSDGDCSSGSGWYRRAALRFLRWAMELEYIDANVLSVINHEVFGHGYRAREFKKYGMEIEGYYFDFSTGRGLTFISVPDGFSLTRSNVMTVGGIEANDVALQRMRWDFVSKNSMPLHEAIFYVAASRDQTDYILISGFSTTGDIHQYVENVNEIHSKPVLSVHELQKYTSWTFLDTFFWLSFWQSMDYVFSGKTTMSVPMLSLTDDLKLLPGFRMVMAPQGPEVQMFNYFKYQDTPVELMLRRGLLTQDSSWAVGLFSRELFKWQHLEIGGRLMLWYQHDFFSKDIVNSISATSYKFGGLGTVMANYWPWGRDKTMAVTLEAGIKTAGFNQGDDVDASLIVRVGARFLI